MNDVFGNSDNLALNFVIVTPPYNSASGGPIALHRLAHELNSIGHRAYLWSSAKNREWSGELVQARDPMDMVQPIPYYIAKPIVVYPEITIGNPLQAVYVVRWILMTPGVNGGDGVYGEKDLIMLWSDKFTVSMKYKVGGLLTTWRDYSHFQDLKLPRSGVCYAVRKGFNKSLNQHPRDAFRIDDYGERGGDAYLINIFNRFEQFICYDHASMLPTLAALCGCVSVVIPDGFHSRRHLEEMGDTFDGVAWGFKDLARARGTLPYARAALERRIQESRVQLTDFIGLCYKQWPELKKNIPVQERGLQVVANDVQGSIKPHPQLRQRMTYVEAPQRGNVLLQRLRK